ncbi:MAG TPA: indole-3-glycerol phosphate synthase TrpC [Acidimicrobiales bacterium]|nr:indole-3-glycerol phosphate synthase TrpC [Acidimicrobiales bacterium]
MTYLDRIVAAHRAAAEHDARPLASMLDRATGMPPTRGFRAALSAAPADEVAVIAEVKRRSPSRGALAPDLDPARLATAYASGGATCLSVLTDEAFFGGSAADLAAARGACNLPVLRKDFTVSERDVADARLMGADAVLLIVAVLVDDELERYLDLAGKVGLDALVEVHDEAELARAAALGADLIGVNQRDLVTFEVDSARAVRLAEALPAGAIGVAESGIRDAADARALHDAGYRAVLVGETLVTSADPTEAVTQLRRCAAS